MAQDVEATALSEPPSSAGTPTGSPAPVSSGRAADARHAARTAGTNFLTVLAGLSELAFHPLTVRLFGTDTYGVYRWAISAIEPLLRLTPLGTETGVLRHIASHRVAGEEDLVRRTLVTGFWLTLITGAIFSVAALVTAGPLAHMQGNPEAASAIRLLAPSLPFAALVVVLISATMGAKTTRYNLVVRGILQPVLLLALSAAVALFTTSLTALCLAHVTAVAVAATLALWAVWRVFRWSPLSRPQKPALRVRDRLNGEMVRFSIPMGVASLCNSILQRTDVILLAFYVGKEMVGIYAGAEAFSRVVSNIRYAFDPVVSPVLSEALRLGDRQRLAYNLKLMTRWATLITLPLLVLLAVFRHDLLRAFPSAFQSAQAVLLVLLLGHLVNGTLGLTGWVISMSGRSTMALVNNLVSAAANVTMCVLLIPRLGILGAALSASASVVLIQVLQVVEVGVLYRTHAFSRGLVKGLVAAAIATAVLHFPLFRTTLPGSLRLPVGTLVLLVVYLGTLFLLGLEREERELLAKLRLRLQRWRRR